MYKFSHASNRRLATCDDRIIVVLQGAILRYDFVVLCGNRSPQEQFELYKQGRMWRDGAWYIADKKKIVTYRDGIIKKSKHNKIPSDAVDVAPYPIDWRDIGRFKKLSGVIMETAGELGIELIWGGNFKKLKDYPHFEV